MLKRLVPGVFTCALFASSAAMAGEITGNGKDLTIHGRSECAFSGRNDTPQGFWIEIPQGSGHFVQIDPGGHVQSYGYFKSHYDWFPSPSDPAAREVRAFPGNGCNPNWTPPQP